MRKVGNEGKVKTGKRLCIDIAHHHATDNERSLVLSHLVAHTCTPHLMPRDYCVCADIKLATVA